MDLVTSERRYFGGFKKGLIAGVSIAIGYVPIALTFGLLAKTTGLSFWMAVSMSVIVYAGASQYMSLSLIAFGTGVIEIILTTLIVNIRHFLMSASLQERVADDRIIVKAAYSFGLTDESFSVVATSKEKLSTGYVVGVFFIAYASWVIFTAIGYVFGAALPETLQEGMTVALYAMFIGLLVPALKGSVKVFFLAVTAGAFNTILTMNEILSTGWSIVTATLLSAFLIELVVYLREKRGKHQNGK